MSASAVFAASRRPFTSESIFVCFSSWALIALARASSATSKVAPSTVTECFMVWSPWGLDAHVHRDFPAQSLAVGIGGSPASKSSTTIASRTIGKDGRVRDARSGDPAHAYEREMCGLKSANVGRAL
jgi:hypothetical protein